MKVKGFIKNITVYLYESSLLVGKKGGQPQFYFMQHLFVFLFPITIMKMIITFKLVPKDCICIILMCWHPTKLALWAEWMAHGWVVRLDLDWGSQSRPQGSNLVAAVLTAAAPGTMAATVHPSTKFPSLKAWKMIEFRTPNTEGRGSPWVHKFSSRTRGGSV